MAFFWHVLFNAANWLPVALTYSFLLGRARILNWGPVGAALVIAYAIHVPLMATGNHLLGLAAGLLMAIGISLFYAWLALRLRGDSFGVMSIAVHLALLAVVLNWPSLTRGALGIPGIPRPSFLQGQEVFALAVTGIAVLWFLLMRRIDKSAFGRKVTAMGEQETYAAALGIDRTIVVIGACLLFGFALWTDNYFFPTYLHLLHTNDYQFPSFVFLLTIVVAGRPGSLWGTTASTILLVALREYIRFVPLDIAVLGPLRLILFGSILFAAVCVQRDRLFPIKRTV